MERRKLDRAGTDDDILFSIDDVVMRGRLVDLTAKGCRIEGNLMPSLKGAPVEVTLIDGVSVKGEVAWSKDATVGVAFYSALSEVTVKYFQLAKVRHDPRAVHPTDRFGRDMPPLAPKARLG